MMELKNILTGVADRLSGLREERPSAGTKYRLMGMVADIAEVAETLSKEVLERVKQEAVLDADVDADFDVMADEVLSWELLRALVAVRLDIGIRKVHLHDLDAAYSIAFPHSTPINVNKKKGHK